MKYLDPKADLIFKKVFGENKDLTISLLNALLPLPKGRQIVNIEYLAPEMVPEIPIWKDSIVDVRCIDDQDRPFIVEMQNLWSKAFMSRVLFNASKAYVRQIKKGIHYSSLKPVYSLNLVNEIFLPDLPDEFIHNYSVVHELHTDKVIDGLQLTFVELPKFRPQTIAERKMAVLWLRFLTEINEGTQNAPTDLEANELTQKALEVVKTAAFTEDELEMYDRFWDHVSYERTIIVDAEENAAKASEEARAKGLAEGLAEGRAEGLNEGMEKGMEKGMERGKEIGIAEGELRAKRTIAQCLLSQGVPIPVITASTGLSEAEVSALRSGD